MAQHSAFSAHEHIQQGPLCCCYAVHAAAALRHEQCERGVCVIRVGFDTVGGGECEKALRVSVRL